MQIVGEIPAHRSGQARHETVEQLEGTEIEFNTEPAVIEPELPCGHESFHGLVWPDEDPPFPFLIHVPLQLFGHISGIGNDDAVNLLVDPSKDVPIIGSWTREPYTKHSAVMVSGHGHFQPIKPAFGRSAEPGKACHGLVSVRVLCEADREVGTVRVFHEVGMLPAEPHEDEQETHRQ